MKKSRFFSFWLIFIFIVNVILFISCNNKVEQINDKVKQAEAKTIESFLRGYSAQTVKDANDWVKIESNNPIPHAILNIAYNDLNKYDLVKYELKLAYNSTENIKKVMYWSSRLAEEKNNSQAYLLKGLSFEIYGDNQTAIDSYYKAIEINPNFRQAYQSLGLLYFFNDNTQEALIIFTVIAKKYPYWAGSYSNFGLIYAKSNEMDKVIKCFEKAVTLEPDNSVNLLNLANAYINTRQTEKAKIVLSRIIVLDPYGEIGLEAKESLSSLSL